MLVLILLIVPAVKPSQIHKISSRLQREAQPGFSITSDGKIVKNTPDSGLTNLQDSIFVGGDYVSGKRRGVSSISSQCPRCPSCRSVSNKLKDFGVDRNPMKGDDAALECGYLGGSHDKLVSLEWEKDQVTFFRYFEKRTPKTQIIPQKWLQLQDISYEKSPERTYGKDVNKLIVTLHDVKPEMSGQYTCVVTFNVTVLKTDDDDVTMMGRIQRDGPLEVNDVTVDIVKVEGDPPTRPNILMDQWANGYDKKYRRPRLFWNENLSMEEVDAWVDGENYTMVYEDGATAYLECVSDYEPSPHLAWSYTEGDIEEGEVELIRADASELVHFHKNGKITRLGLRVALGNKWAFHCQLTPRNEAAEPITSAVEVSKTIDYDGNAEFELLFIGEIGNDPDPEPETIEVTVKDKLSWTILMAIGAGAGLLLAICLACCCCRCRRRAREQERERKVNAIMRDGRENGGRGRSSKRKAPKPLMVN